MGDEEAMSEVLYKLIFEHNPDVRPANRRNYLQIIRIISGRIHYRLLEIISVEPDMSPKNRKAQIVSPALSDFPAI
ncbi:MAG: hypothetical protein HGB36_13420 [Chlorobiaceae bacterium]|jgi:hypothetical protein|nr:hypothetical protein [Chlorobiaceae bacterium]